MYQENPARTEAISTYLSTFTVCADSHNDECECTDAQCTAIGEMFAAPQQWMDLRGLLEELLNSGIHTVEAVESILVAYFGGDDGKPTITICFDETAASNGDKRPWFTREGESHETLPLHIVGDYHTGSEWLLMALDEDGDYSGHHVNLERGDGATVELR